LEKEGMASREQDKAMAGLLRRTLASDAAGAEGKDCPAPEVLAAYYDRALGVDETARYDLHFSQCSRCREQLAAMARASDADGGEKKAAHGWNWLRTPRWLMPTAAAFAVLVLIAGITLRKWKSVKVANEVTMLRPDAVPLPAPAGTERANAASLTLPGSAKPIVIGRRGARQDCTRVVLACVAVEWPEERTRRDQGSARKKCACSASN
jgi:hypothetical protein